MKNTLNDDVISIIKERLPEGHLIVPYLMKILFLGKESIYRRLRGEVSFTFDEVATISFKLGFSIDNLVGLKQSQRVIFDTDLHKRLAPEDMYAKKLQNFIKFFDNARESETVVNRFAKNYIPYSFSLYCETLTKFRYYKWMHQMLTIDPDFAMCDLIVPAKISDLRKQWIAVTDRTMVQATYIFDNNLITSMCRDISYFYKSGLIKDEELEQLQNELVELINHIERLARTGRGQTGAKVQFYLLPFDLGATYSHTEYHNKEACHIQIHAIDALQSYNPHVCNIQKNWIDLLKRYSVLITQSGEMQRLEYFKKQREHIFNIGCNNQ